MTDYCEVCNDDRNAMVAKYFEKLKDATNIETSQEEMQVIGNILFRFWQLGWLHKIDAADVRGEWKEERMKHIGTGEIRTVRICSVCDAGYFRYDMSDGIVDVVPHFCPNCGAEMREGEG